MRRPRFSTTDLDALQRQLDSWRQTHVPYRRLPEEAWAAAALLAARLGVSRVAHALGLDYNKLKDLAAPAPALPARAAASTVPPGFVEVEWNNWSAPGPPHAAQCRVEFYDRAGGRVSVQAPAGSPVLLGLAQVFWRRAQ